MIDSDVIIGLPANTIFLAAVGSVDNNLQYTYALSLKSGLLLASVDKFNTVCINSFDLFGFLRNNVTIAVNNCNCTSF